jgi:hypothetical protein
MYTCCVHKDTSIIRCVVVLHYCIKPVPLIFRKGMLMCTALNHPAVVQNAFTGITYTLLLKTRYIHVVSLLFCKIRISILWKKCVQVPQRVVYRLYILVNICYFCCLRLRKYILYVYRKGSVKCITWNPLYTHMREMKSSVLHITVYMLFSVVSPLNYVYVYVYT